MATRKPVILSRPKAVTPAKSASSSRLSTSALDNMFAKESRIIEPIRDDAAQIAKGGNEHLESFSASVPLVVAPVAGIGSEVTIYTTAKRWRGVDVYMMPQFAVNPGANLLYVRICVYAIGVGLGRTLVASGWYTASDYTSIRGSRRKWVAAARSIGEQFEITATLIGSGGAAAGTEFRTLFAIEASDECSDPPDGVGVGKMFEAEQTVVGATVPFVAGSNTADYGTEIFSVQARNEDAAVRWLVFCDNVSVVATAARFAIRLAPSTEVRVGPDYFRGRRFGASGLFVGASSIAASYDGLGTNVFWNVWCR